MTQPAVSLDLVQIASPCHVSWDDMSGDDRRRFCRHCNLHVYNLSDMPRADAGRTARCFRAIAPSACERCANDWCGRWPHWPACCWRSFPARFSADDSRIWIFPVLVVQRTPFQSGSNQDRPSPARLA